MIINIHFNKFSENKFIFDGPYLYLDPDCKYTISLLHLHFHIENQRYPQPSNITDLWVLSTSLVDKSPANPEQALSYFTWTKQRLTQDFIPRSFIKYPLEVHQLDNPHFEIKRIKENTNLKLEGAFIQLEIIKKCSDSASA
jgi:hypothetical protein